MRKFIISVVALTSFALGLGIFAVFHIHASDAEGQRLNCVDHGSICLGMDARRALLKASPDLGGLWDVLCDFKRPNANVRDTIMLDEIIAHGCAASNYMALFSDGKYVTAIWIDDGKVERLDRTPAYDKGI